MPAYCSLPAMNSPSRVISRPRHRLAVLTLPLLGIVMLAAACGGSSKANSASTTPTTAGGAGRGFAAARAKFTSCLESHGVPSSQASQAFGGFRRGSASSPSTPPTTSATYGAAFQACRSDLPARGAGGGFTNSAAGRAYLQCLQLHGVTVPSTPSGSGSGGPGSGFGALNSNPNFQAARQACASLAPTRGGSPTTSIPAAA